MLIKTKNMFDIISEADDDQTTDTPAADAGTTEEAPAPEESGEDAGDDDFDIDTDLDDLGDDEGGEDTTDSGNTSTDLDTSSGSSDSEEDEPVEANTDMFATLSAEEQQAKISELKKQFGILYSSVDDTLIKINNTETDENNIEVVQKITDSLIAMKRYIMDYLTIHFPNKSFLENDIMYNRFLTIISSISTVLEEMGKIIHKDEKNDKK